METNELVKALRKEVAANPCAGLCSACDISECMTRLQIQAADQIEEQDAEIKALRDKVPEWIPVSERLPEPGKMVLLTVSGKFKNISFVDAYELGEFDTDEGWILEMWPEWKDLKVTHWMPLPELPEEEKHEK